ncbi:hypothetical protein ACSBR1_040578 [Camellia fascicularis]
MEFFNKAKAVKLRCHHNKYLVADDDQEKVRQSKNGSSRKARWVVEFVPDNTQVLRLKSCHGRYLTATNQPFLLGMTGNKVLQTQPENMRDMFIDWKPEKDGFHQLKLRAFGGTYLRANGGSPPWRNSITHDSPYTSSTSKWILWDVEVVEIPENEPLNDYLSMLSSFSSVSDDVLSEIGSPVSIHSINSPRLSIHQTYSPRLSMQKSSTMDMFKNAKAVRLQSIHNKFLHAEDDEETVTQDRNGSSKSARWTVEFVSSDDNNIIRLKSCYGKYLTASNHPFLLGMTGRKVLQTLPSSSGARLDSSVEWEPISEGNRVKLKTRYGKFLRANGGMPPWRNTVTHDIPHRSATQDWILWDVHIVEILVQSSHHKPPVQIQSLQHSDSFATDFESSSPTTNPKPPTSIPIQSLQHSDSFAVDSDSNSPTTYYSTESRSFGRQEEWSESSPRPTAVVDGRTIYYQVADEYGNVDDRLEEFCITFNGNVVGELIQKLEEETGLDDIIVCSRNPLNRKLYPLRLQLPPNNATMHVVVIESSSNGAREF